MPAIFFVFCLFVMWIFSVSPGLCGRVLVLGGFVHVYCSVRVSGPGGRGWVSGTRAKGRFFREVFRGVCSEGPGPVEQPLEQGMISLSGFPSGLSGLFGLFGQGETHERAGVAAACAACDGEVCCGVGCGVSQGDVGVVGSDWGGQGDVEFSLSGFAGACDPWHVEEDFPRHGQFVCRVLYCYFEGANGRFGAAAGDVEAGGVKKKPVGQFR